MTLAEPRPVRLAKPLALTRFLHRHEGWRGYVMLGPALLLMAAAILFPLGMTLVMSTWSLSGYEMNTTPSLGNYVAMTENPMFRVLIWRSLTIAATCTLITVALCYPMAYFVAFHGGRHKALWLIILTLPFWTSYLLRIFAWKVVLGYEGVLNTALMGLGVVDEPVAALLYSQTAVTVVLAHAWAAFAILPIYVSLEKIDRTYLEAAVLMFVPTVGEYITPAMVGGPDGMMIGNLIQAMFGAMNNWPAGAALSVVMIVTIGLAGLVFLALNRLMQR